MMYVVKDIRERGSGVSVEIYIPDLDETHFVGFDALEFYRMSEDDIDRELERLVEAREKLHKMKNDPNSKIQGMINDKESLKDRLNKRVEEKHRERSE